jgi:hypothetical protein
MYAHKSGLNFLQRCGLVRTYKNNEPQIEPGALKIHTEPLESPLPLPNLLYPLEGDYSPPDRGQTDLWPHLEEDDE